MQSSRTVHRRQDDVFRVGWPHGRRRGAHSAAALVPRTQDEQAVLQGLIAAREAQPVPQRRNISPREACFAFGVANLRQVRGSPNPRAASIADALRQATPQDCLDAAFCLFGGPTPVEIVRAAHAPSPTPPFQDADYFAALAQWLGLTFDAHARILLHARRPALETVIEEDGEVLRFECNGERYIAVAPASRWLPGLAATVCCRPDIKPRLVVVPAHAILSIARPTGPSTVRGRINPLHLVPSKDLAEQVISPAQAVAFGLGVAALVAILVAAPVFALRWAVVLSTFVLLAYAGMRALALAEPLRLGAATPPRRELTSAELPRYSILIPLYREDGSLVHLVRALRRLDYPREKLDIVFLVEADDPGTEAAVRRESVSLRCRIIVVPPGEPRTKPRALNAGLRQARGSIVTIYDAEDRPDPGQLRVAAETLAAAPATLAGVQACLSIDHATDNWLTKMFAIEYACLFDHIMPMVARRRRLFLLGGTSNHFRTEALVEVGGWDPYNVTEDADLAVRLRRRGYEMAMIDSETFEEAPISIPAWMKQRARWFKGYIQTWLVHHRRPLELYREIGLMNVVLLNVFIVGALTAALAHVSFMTQLVLAGLGILPLFEGQNAVLVALQSFAVAAGYGANIALGAISLRRRTRSRIGLAAVLWFPVYWLLMGGAVLLAVYDLVRRPHHWRKTTHGLARRPARVHRTRTSSSPPSWAEARPAAAG